MARAARIINRIFLLIGLLLLLAVLVIGFTSAAVNWHGLCDQMSGEQVPCTRMRFAMGEIFWTAFLFIPFFFIAGIVNLVMTLAQFIVMLVQRHRRQT